MVAFEEGNIYICMLNDTSTVILQEVIDINGAKTIVNSMSDKLSKFHTSKVNIGGVSLIARKSFLEKEHILWYDNNSKRVSENMVVWLIAYLESMPTRISYNRKSDDAIKELEDEAFAQDMEELIKIKEFHVVVKLMKEYVIENEGDLNISIDTYEKDKRQNSEDNYIVVTYLLTMKNDEFVIDRIIHRNDEFKRRTDEISRIGEDELVDFFNEKYSKEYTMIVGQSLVDIQKSTDKKDLEVHK